LHKELFYPKGAEKGPAAWRIRRVGMNVGQGSKRKTIKDFGRGGPKIPLGI